MSTSAATLSKRRPWVTITLSALMIVAGLASPLLLGQLNALWDAHAARAAARLKLTLLTAFFLHDSPWKLLTNLGLFWLFATNIEQRLGKGQLLLLVGVATLPGWLFYAGGARPTEALPVVGAGGAISGIIFYYMFAFTYVPLVFRLPRSPSRYTVPAWPFMFTWMAIQFIQDSGRSSGNRLSPGFLAHAGGIIAGMVLWITVFLITRRKAREQEKG